MARGFTSGTHARLMTYCAGLHRPPAQTETVCVRLGRLSATTALSRKDDCSVCKSLLFPARTLSVSHHPTPKRNKLPVMPLFWNQIPSSLRPCFSRQEPSTDTQHKPEWFEHSQPTPPYYQSYYFNHSFPHEPTWSGGRLSSVLTLPWGWTLLSKLCMQGFWRITECAWFSIHFWCCNLSPAPFSTYFNDI